ncbi:putative membrane protein [Catalinimonas alkaloidigena]|uniref:TMEM175 family protein n=1 Tax=Catalinimonas alkaloidigena TaxID=1075417 RepID=UPI0024075F78|nr:TMEM175 family protein [Catalinimonas alkaloidigena]MDF9800501.1 putative membrane protein [Catalinimonas alkaloidigena]
MRAWLRNKQSKTADYIFSQRGTESSRLEQLSDGVFALAITLLLVSLETPKTGDELVLFAKDFLSFALSTIILIVIWYSHYLYFLRYGLRDKTTTIINTWLLVVVLFFVYPLKFIISFMLGYLKYLFLMTFGFDYDQQAFIYLVTEVSSWEKLPFIMMIYSGGYLALMLSFAFFYRHAYKNREALALSPEEEEKTCLLMMLCFIQCSVALISIVIAFGATFSSIPWLAILAGMVYFLLGPLVFVFERVFRKRKQRARLD